MGMMMFHLPKMGHAPLTRAAKAEDWPEVSRLLAGRPLPSSVAEQLIEDNCAPAVRWLLAQRLWPEPGFKWLCYAWHPDQLTPTFLALVEATSNDDKNKFAKWINYETKRLRAPSVSLLPANIRGAIVRHFVTTYASGYRKKEYEWVVLQRLSIVQASVPPLYELWPLMLSGKFSHDHDEYNEFFQDKLPWTQTDCHMLQFVPDDRAVKLLQDHWARGQVVLDRGVQALLLRRGSLTLLQEAVNSGNVTVDTALLHAYMVSAPANGDYWAAVEWLRARAEAKWSDVRTAWPQFRVSIINARAIQAFRQLLLVPEVYSPDLLLGDGEPLLHFFARHGELAWVEAWLAHGADLARQFQGLTAEQAASRTPVGQACAMMLRAAALTQLALPPPYDAPPLHEAHKPE